MKTLVLTVIATVLLWGVTASATMLSSNSEIRVAIERDILPIFAKLEAQGLTVYGILDIVTWEHKKNRQIKVWEVQVVLPVCEMGMCVLAVQTFYFQAMPHLEARMIRVTEPSEWPQW